MSQAWCSGLESVFEGLELVLIVKHGARAHDHPSALGQHMMCTCVYSVWITHMYHLTWTHVLLFSSPLSTDLPIPTNPGLNNLYLATQKNPGTETKLRQQLEQELEMQKSIRQEKEVSYSFFPIIRILYHNGMCVSITHLTDIPPTIRKWKAGRNSGTLGY